MKRTNLRGWNRSCANHQIKDSWNYKYAPTYNGLFFPFLNVWRQYIFNRNWLWILISSCTNHMRYGSLYNAGQWQQAHSPSYTRKITRVNNQYSTACCAGKYRKLVRVNVLLLLFSSSLGLLGYNLSWIQEHLYIFSSQNVSPSLIFHLH